MLAVRALSLLPLLQRERDILGSCPPLLPTHGKEEIEGSYAREPIFYHGPYANRGDGGHYYLRFFFHPVATFWEFGFFF